MKFVPLDLLVRSMDSGARPKGGVSGTSGTIPSLGGEHLSGDGGFCFLSMKYVDEAFFNSLDKGKIQKNNILIVKDGATTGKTSFVGDDFPFDLAAINEHVFRIDVNEQEADPKYLFRFLISSNGKRELLKDFRGATVGGITRDILHKAQVPIPASVIEQRRIAAILDKADTISKKRAAVILDAGKYLRSAFFDLFGDPVANSKGLPEKPIAELARVTTGNTPSREIDAYFGNYIEWIKSDNLNTPFHFLTKAAEGLSEAGLRVARSVPAGSTLITCIAGSPSCIGNAALADRNVSFNQQINALTPKPGIEPEFIYAATLFSKPRIQAASTNGMKGMVSKGALEQVRFILPPQDQREKFAGIFRKVMALTEKLEHSASEANALYGSLAQRAFQGKL